VRIALIEDNEALANGIAHCLRDSGHAVDLLGDGVSADAFLTEDGADLVILDVNLPLLDGIEVLRNLRRRNDATPVILLTARGAVENRVEGLDAGADDYLVKPFDMTERESCGLVRSVMSRRRTSCGTRACHLICRVRNARCLNAFSGIATVWPRKRPC